MKLERSFRTGQVIPFLKTLKNCVYFPIQQLAIVGDPDYLICINGLFVALELKKSGKEPEGIQKYKLEQIKNKGGVSISASEDNWEEVKQILLNLDKGDKNGNT